MYLLWLKGLFSLHVLITFRLWNWVALKQKQSTTHEGKLLANNSLLGLCSASYISQDHLARIGTHCDGDSSSLNIPSSQISLAVSHCTPLLRQPQRSLCPLLLVQLIVYSCSSGEHIWIASLPYAPPPSVIRQWRNALVRWPKCDELSKHGHLPLLRSSMGAQNSLVLPLNSWLSLSPTPTTVADLPWGCTYM